MFEAPTVVPYVSMDREASIIPLGNLLREGKDFGETFSSTVSGVGLRWFCSLAVTCAKMIKGSDAQTGYLQCEQRIPVYAYLPSRHGFSDLPFEQLGLLCLQLMGILKDEGLQGVKKFARAIRKDRRDKPVVFYKIMQDNKGEVVDYLIVITWVDNWLQVLWHRENGGGIRVERDATLQVCV